MATSIGLVLMFFYSEYGRRSQQDANRLAKENNGFAKASIEFSQWDYCVSKVGMTVLAPGDEMLY